MKIITITGYKGGVSKSTTAIHLATFLSDHGKVLLVDGDRNRTAIQWKARGDLPFDVTDEKTALKLVGGQDFLVIDTAAQPTSEDLATLSDGCDLMILPTQPDVVSLEPMIQTAKDVSGCEWRALITIVPPRPSKDGAQLKADLMESKIPVFEAMIRRSAGVGKAALEGKPLRDMPARSRLAWLDYEKLGYEVLEILDVKI